MFRRLEASNNGKFAKKYEQTSIDYVNRKFLGRNEDLKVDR